MRQTRLSHRSGKRDEETATRASAREAPSYFGDMMSLQSTMGNAAVGNLVRSRERATHEAPTPIDAYTQSLIARQTGGPEVVTSQAGTRIHHGPESDMLTRILGATGFTQGNDVFLRSDRHPTSEAGRATLAHELTHVARGSVGPGAVMREPDVSTAEPMDAQKAGKSVIMAKLTLDDGSVINGGSKVTGHTGEIELDSLSFANASGTIGGAKEGQKENAKDLNCTKQLDDATTTLFRAQVEGTHIKTATFVFIKPGDDGSSQEYLTLTFTDGFVTADRPTSDAEMVSFNFKTGP